MTKKLPLLARILLGSVFFIFGLNGFFHFIPMPPQTGPLAVYFAGMLATGYFLPLLAGVQTFCGALLLVGAFVPLALIILAPVIVNIVLLHIFLDPKGLVMAVIISLLEAYLAFFADPYRAVVKQIFRCPMKEAMDANKK